MLSLVVALASVRAEFKELGPCYLYDRYCLETIWKQEKDGGSDKAFGIDFTGNSWRETPEKHYKGCFDVEKCKASGIALVCKTSNQAKFEKTYVASPPDSADDATFYSYIDKLPENANDICVTLEAKVGKEQPLDTHSKRGSNFVAKFITEVRNIKKSTECKSGPTSVEKPAENSAGPTTPGTLKCEKSELQIDMHPTTCQKKEGDVTFHFGLDAAETVTVCIQNPDSTKWLAFGSARDMSAGFVSVSADGPEDHEVTAVYKLEGYSLPKKEGGKRFDSAKDIKKGNVRTLCVKLKKMDLIDKESTDMSKAPFVFAIGTSAAFDRKHGSQKQITLDLASSMESSDTATASPPATSTATTDDSSDTATASPPATSTATTDDNSKNKLDFELLVSGGKTAAVAYTSCSSTTNGFFSCAEKKQSLGGNVTWIAQDPDNLNTVYAVIENTGSEGGVQKWTRAANADSGWKKDGDNRGLCEKCEPPAPVHAVVVNELLVVSWFNWGGKPGGLAIHKKADLSKKYTITLDKSGSHGAFVHNEYIYFARYKNQTVCWLSVAFLKNHATDVSFDAISDTSKGCVSTTGQAWPRHIAFSGDDKAYVACEHNGQGNNLYVYNVASDGKLEFLKNYCLSSETGETSGTCGETASKEVDHLSEIRVYKDYVYVSNRVAHPDFTSPKSSRGNGIFVLRRKHIDADAQKLPLLNGKDGGVAPKYIRSMDVSPNGHFLVAAGEHSDKTIVYWKLDSSTGAIQNVTGTELGKYEDKASFVSFVAFEKKGGDKTTGSTPAKGKGGDTAATSTPATSTPATSTPATSTPATSTPATDDGSDTATASTPATSTPATSTPATSTSATSTAATSTPATSAPATSTPATDDSSDTATASTPATDNGKAGSPAKEKDGSGTDFPVLPVVIGVVVALVLAISLVMYFYFKSRKTNCSTSTPKKPQLVKSKSKSDYRLGGRE